MDIEIVKNYAPHIYYDKKEPFIPLRVGYTILYESGISPSFDRYIEIKDTDFVIEYAIYWDFDIQHLFDLEHIWVHIDNKGNIVDCEASFHGKYIKALMKDRSNIEDKTHVRLYCQPGKHAFMPKAEYFYMIPNMYEVNDEKAGIDGLIVTEIGRGRYETNEKINKMVERCLRGYRFKPSMEFQMKNITDDMYVTWEELYVEIPELIKNKLEEINKKELGIKI
ncbi:hypothetical protein SH1V18_02010 [Vallitalea longa]|uniref:Uncharacterized protein n=1 Tax=Vallitalea longa TaxID=2936439 RepID=A0A9W6DCY9_9FIRM|nr:hypothetical protein [Vallitalea longa]GKX27721.1 hypothetical protein SH1V18_02010 [Vallitalea longa]